MRVKRIVEAREIPWNAKVARHPEVHGVTRLLQCQGNQHGAVLRTRYDEDLLRFCIDSTRRKQAFTNELAQCQIAGTLTECIEERRVAKYPAKALSKLAHR